MNKEQVKQLYLSDGNCYSGWGYNTIKGFVPDGCGKNILRTIMFMAISEMEI